MHWLGVAVLQLLTPHAVLLMTAALNSVWLQGAAAAQPLLPGRPTVLRLLQPTSHNCHKEEQRETEGECVGVVKLAEVMPSTPVSG